MLTQCNTGYSGAACATGSGGDNGGLYVCADGTCNTEGTASIGQQYQNFIVTSVSNSSGTYTVGISPAVYMPNWSYAQDAHSDLEQHGLQWHRCGTEDMTIYNGWVNSNDTYASWIKGVRFVQAASSGPMTISKISNGLIANNYFFNDTGFGRSYCAGIRGI